MPDPTTPPTEFVLYVAVSAGFHVVREQPDTVLLWVPQAWRAAGAFFTDDAQEMGVAPLPTEPGVYRLHVTHRVDPDPAGDGDFFDVHETEQVWSVMEQVRYAPCQPFHPSQGFTCDLPAGHAGTHVGTRPPSEPTTAPPSHLTSTGPCCWCGQDRHFTEREPTVCAYCLRYVCYSCGETAHEGGNTCHAPEAHDASDPMAVVAQDVTAVDTPATPGKCRLCAGRGRVHEDREDRDKPVYVQIQGPDLTDGTPHPYRVVPCRGCKGLEREPEANEVILTTTELEALPEYSASLPTGTVVGKQWRKSDTAHPPLNSPSEILRDPGWVRGEYVDHDDSRYIGIVWKEITIHDSPLRVGDVCPQCNGRGQEAIGSGRRGVIGMHFEQCHECNGTGQVRPSLAEQYAKADAKGPVPGA